MTAEADSVNATKAAIAEYFYARMKDAYKLSADTTKQGDTISTRNEFDKQEADTRRILLANNRTKGAVFELKDDLNETLYDAYAKLRKGQNEARDDGAAAANSTENLDEELVTASHVTESACAHTTQSSSLQL